MRLIHADPNFLMHYGVLGQKWGVRRFQNEDGTLTQAGKDRYRTEKILPRIYRGTHNTLSGQRIAVGLNRGYRKDRKEIKGEYKVLKKGMKAEYKAQRKAADEENGEVKTRKEYRTELKSLKNDYKETKKEARTAAAQAIYPWQSDVTNKRIQSQGHISALFKNYVTGNYGALTLERARAEGKSTIGAWARGVAMDVLNNFSGGILSVGDFIMGRSESKAREREAAQRYAEAHKDE